MGPCARRGSAGIRSSTQHRTTGSACRSVGSARRSRSLPRDEMGHLDQGRAAARAESDGRPAVGQPTGSMVPGDVVRQWDFSRDGILRSIEASLRRLRTDHVDVLYLHDPDLSGIDGAAELGTKTLIELRDEGVARAVGIGSNSSAAVAELFERADIDIAMLAGRYTLLEQHGVAGSSRPPVSGASSRSGCSTRGCSPRPPTRRRDLRLPSGSRRADRPRQRARRCRRAARRHAAAGRDRVPAASSTGVECCDRHAVGGPGHPQRRPL